MNWTLNGAWRPLVRLIVLSACALTGPQAQAFSTSATACGNVWYYDCASQSGASSFAAQAGPGAYERTYRAMADASPGALKAAVGATANDEGGQDARATATFQDAIYFNLPAGTTEFEVVISMDLHGNCGGAAYRFSCFAQMNLSAGRGRNNINLNLQQPGRATGTLTLRAGDDLPLDSYLDVRCHASFGYCSADYSQTGLVSLASPTPGVTFYSESGHIYTVPEPGSVWLWAGGLLAGGVAAGRRRASRRASPD